MQFHDRFRIAQSQSEPFHVMHVPARHPIETYEHLVLRLFRNSDSCVPNSNNKTVTLLFRLYVYIQRIMGIFDGIINQISDNIQHMYLVRRYYITFRV